MLFQGVELPRRTFVEGLLTIGENYEKNKRLYFNVIRSWDISVFNSFIYRIVLFRALSQDIRIITIT